MPKGITFLRHSLHPVMERYRVSREPADESGHSHCVPFAHFFLAAIFSGLLEKVPLLGNLHILTIVGGLALIIVGLGGRLPAVLDNPIAKCLLVFTFWFIVCTPFGEWPGGSVVLFRDIWSRSALSFVLVAGCDVSHQIEET